MLALPAAAKLQTLSRWRPLQPAHCKSAAAKQRARPAHVTVSAGASGVAPAAATSLSDVALDHNWQWQGHKIHYMSAGGEGPTVVLVHGFGVSGLHWRRSIPELVRAGYRVFAVDLLGQGRSEKATVSYSIELWAEQLGAFLQEVVGEPAVLVGNSVGSLAALTAAARLARGSVTGLVLLNCAGGMNNKAIADDWRIQVAMPIFSLIDWILLQPRLARFFFDRVRQRESLRKTLQNVYTNKESVDDELVDLIHLPSNDDGALECFVSIITGPPGPRPEELIPDLECPLLVLWGDRDTFTPADGPVGRYFQALPQTRPDTIFEFLEGASHVPHDDQPELVHQHLLPWLRSLQAGQH